MTDYTKRQLALFDVFWGFAPEGTVKHKKGEEVKIFLKTILEEQAAELKKEPEGWAWEIHDALNFENDYAELSPESAEEKLRLRLNELREKI